MKSLPSLLLACLFCLFFAPRSLRAQERPHFNHVAVYVVDLKKSADFYQKVMNLEVIPEPFHDNRHVWFRISEHGQLHVISGAKTKEARDIDVHLSLAVSDLPAFIKRLEALHVPYSNFAGEPGKIQVRTDKIEQVYLQDPDGYWIEVNNDKY